MLKAISAYRKSKKKVESHQSFTQYIRDSKMGIVFPVTNDENICKFYEYPRATAFHMREDPIEYSCTARESNCKTFEVSILESSIKYLIVCRKL